MLISRLGETRHEQEWSNGTEFSGYSDSPEFWANLARYTQNFGMKFQKTSVPFAPQPGISGIFGRMESAREKGCYLEQTQFPYCLNSHQ